MTRSLGAARSSTRRPPRAHRAPRKGPFSRLGFTCFRLVAIHDGAPDEPPFDVIELIDVRNAMGAFMLAPATI